VHHADRFAVLIRVERAESFHECCATFGDPVPTATRGSQSIGDEQCKVVLEPSPSIGEPRSSRGIGELALIERSTMQSSTFAYISVLEDCERICCKEVVVGDALEIDPLGVCRGDLVEKYR
jgi:hypothetical protein